MLGRGLFLSVLSLESTKSEVLYQPAPLKTKSQLSTLHSHNVKLTLSIVNENNIGVVPNFIRESILRRLLRTDDLFELMMHAFLCLCMCALLMSPNCLKKSQTALTFDFAAGKFLTKIEKHRGLIAD